MKIILNFFHRFHTSLFQEDVSESVSIGYSILKVQAYDADEGPNSQISYSIGSRDLSGGSTEDFPIAVNSDTGWIYTIKQLDREQCSKYNFVVVASDSGEPPRSASATVMISVTDINDNDPYFDPKSYEAVVSENVSPGTPVTMVTATDPDEDSRIHYEITSGNTRGRVFRLNYYNFRSNSEPIILIIDVCFLKRSFFNNISKRTRSYNGFPASGLQAREALRPHGYGIGLRRSQ